MKLIYTDIRNPLTKILSKEAAGLAQAGKRVFYIAPNSLSFEKERAVLSMLEHQASFAITVTRFVQLARYFVLNEVQEGQNLDDIGLGMLLYQSLANMDDQDLQVYGRIKTDPQFIQQLLELYHELQGAQMTAADLDYLEEAEKKADLIKILQTVTKNLDSSHFHSESKMMTFVKQIAAGNLDTALKNTALVIDGFTRFSAEEAYLIQLLHKKGVEIVIGAYASEKAYHANFREGNLYQASVDFLRQLAAAYQVKPVYIPAWQKEDTFAKVSKLLESRYDFSELDMELTEQDQSCLQIWSAASQKEELEYVAKAIRQKVHDGTRYKDIRLLLGDVEAYRLPLKTIFDQYQIPFYLGRREPMAQHPLVQFIESLLRIKRYDYRTEDVLNLLKTGLCGNMTQEEEDLFEQYVRFADIKGVHLFSKDFVYRQQDQFNLTVLNRLRKTFIAPLLSLFQTRRQKASGLLKNFQQFLLKVDLSGNLAHLFADSSQEDRERQEEVWKAFCHVLEQFASVFEKDQVGIEEFLELIRSGMLLSSYRTTPATVDVVTVQSYDLIEPLSSPLVFAVGLTQNHFPKIVQHKSLLTDEDRARLNERTGEQAELLIASKENLKKNRFAALSLINAARQELVLSTPQIVNEMEDTISPYLLELHTLGLPIQVKQPQASSDDIGNYRALLARVIELNQGEIDAQWTAGAKEQTFWSAAVRVLRRKLETKGIRIPNLTVSLKTKPLSQQTLQVLYPQGQPLTLSASALTEFYRHQYAYFLKYVLSLQEEASIHPSNLSHGNFLHRIFEKVMQDAADDTFDDRLERAIQSTSQEADFKAIYTGDAQAEFSRELLLDTAHATGVVLAANQLVETIQEEAVFGKNDSGFLTLADGHSLTIRGKVDRIDRLKENGSLGIVDYKSSRNNFNFLKFFNGLHSQLPTYLTALEREKWGENQARAFGAMYLQMSNPIVPLFKTKSKGDAVKEAMKSFEFKGLFLAEETKALSSLYDTSKTHLLTQEELAVLLAYNTLLYRQAAEQILQGHFKINPYTENGRSIAPFVEQYKAITGFEANLHLGAARQLTKLDLSQYEKKPTGEKLRQAWIEKMKEELEK